MEGTFEVFARHQPGSPMERRSRLALLEGASVLLGPGEERTLALSVPADVVPAAAHVLVFKGRLGLEEGAVAGQIFTVPYVEVRQTSYDADLAPLLRAAATLGRVAALSKRRHGDHPLRIHTVRVARREPPRQRHIRNEHVDRSSDGPSRTGHRAD